MSDLNRREFARNTLGTLLSYSLLETMFRKDAFADEIKPTAIKWLADVNSLAADVRSQKIPQIEWQKQVEALFKKIDVADVLKLIDFEAITKDLKIADNGASSLRPKFPKVEGLPTEFVFGRQVFALKKGRSVVRSNARRKRAHRHQADCRSHVQCGRDIVDLRRQRQRALVSSDVGDRLHLQHPCSGSAPWRR